MPSSILLRGGTLLVPDGETERVVPARRDLLVVGDRIASIEEHIDLAAHDLAAHDLAAHDLADVMQVDCSDRIVSPGFIDTHHHLWQTQLKGRHADHTVLDYMPSGNLSGCFFTPSDVYWGQLGGALEALDSGTTTVVDQAHMNYQVEHSEHALAATLTSGIRSVFCYTPTPRVECWQPRLGLAPSILQPWHLPQFARFANLLAAHPRVSLGFGFDGYAFLAPADTRALFQEVRAAGARCITSHCFGNPLLAGGKGVVTVMAEASLLGPDVIVSHATGITPAEEALLAEHGAFVSCTPACEAQLGLGARSAFDGSTRTSLGCDSHSVTRGSMLDQIRLALALARTQRTQTLLATSKYPRAMKPTVQDAFQLATCHAARAVGLRDEIGKLQVGFKADIVTWDCTTPSMACAAAEDPVAALVCHAGTRDIDCVLVDGAFRKRAGKLCDLDCTTQDPTPARSLLASSSLGAHADNSTLAWTRVARELERSRREIQDRMAGARRTGAQGQEAIIDAFGLDGSALTH
ncbi:hypothetical protein SLS60_002529 [Paraconiothyrium brasiliense]|uniref:Amidohydrolase-related domain-containing protein n=1 Tax=Paraconiothyrium brasiliense TaxID=300254 RepID=A0ABR3S318_9PLEO